MHALTGPATTGSSCCEKILLDTRAYFFFVVVGITRAGLAINSHVMYFVILNGRTALLPSMLRRLYKNLARSGFLYA